MRRLIAVLAAGLAITCAAAQGTPHSHHSPAPTPAPAAAMAQSGYRSPFAGYRPFAEEASLKDWRRANDEVRDAGGHIGLMKGQSALPAGHGAHGAHGGHGAKPPAMPDKPAERK